MGKWCSESHRAEWGRNASLANDRAMWWTSSVVVGCCLVEMCRRLVEFRSAVDVLIIKLLLPEIDASAVDEMYRRRKWRGDDEENITLDESEDDRSDLCSKVFYRGVSERIRWLLDYIFSTAFFLIVFLKNGEISTSQWPRVEREVAGMKKYIHMQIHMQIL